MLICVWLVFWFTAFVPSPTTQYDLAWYFLYLIGIDSICNVLVLVVSLLRKVFSALKAAFYKRKAKKALEKAQLQKADLSAAAKSEIKSNNDLSFIIHDSLQHQDQQQLSYDSESSESVDYAAANRIMPAPRDS